MRKILQSWSVLMHVFIKWKVHYIYTADQYTIPTGYNLKNIICSREFYKNTREVSFNYLQLQILPLSLIHTSYRKGLGLWKSLLSQNYNSHAYTVKFCGQIRSRPQLLKEFIHRMESQENRLLCKWGSPRQTLSDVYPRQAIMCIT